MAGRTARFILQARSRCLGLLSADGRAQGSYVAPPLGLGALVGQRFDFAAGKLAGADGPGFASNPDGFLIVP